MIRYSCDLCGRDLDPRSDVRFAVSVQIKAAFDPDPNDEQDDERDHLEEIQNALERLRDDDQEDGEQLQQEFHFDLCSECRRRFARRPLGNEIAKLCNFSEN